MASVLASCCLGSNNELITLRILRSMQPPMYCNVRNGFAGKSSKSALLLSQRNQRFNSHMSSLIDV
ncbi:CLUMA_CG007024, isoform A [Clunio marinus]|uniref:CLUMA_CG007024, isoform A n=1 Tax=Clunio marinus TaxID=568069 RepID=A0A1J1HZF9_9DIPT|nr:CLUMA_CG007024, isoform A [Clunio marinus]